jgi:hypothetical protein
MEVRVGPVEPVGAGGREDVHVQRVLEGRGLVGEMRGDVEDLAGPDRDLAVEGLAQRKWRAPLTM